MRGKMITNNQKKELIESLKDNLSKINGIKLLFTIITHLKTRKGKYNEQLSEKSK
jgi:hypothetical protein